MSALTILLANGLVFCVRFGVFVGLSVLFAKVGRMLGLLQRIQPARPSAAELLAQAGWSILSAAIFVGVVALLLLAPENGYSRIYFDVDDYGTTWLGVSVLIAIIVHDAYFYWTHRLMHESAWLWCSHRLHHTFTNPSGWAAFSFHPAEAIIEAGVVVVVAFLIPVHPLALFAFTTIMTAQSVAIHSGFELSDGTRRRLPASWIWLGSRAHNQHHTGVPGNFGLYTPWWDLAMGTYVGPRER